ncbi:MAG: uracil-DNA glycosylase [Desulfurococcales archaeon]|nr:uracil-DNA glycosylase [Desulfurococcales archaeon]MEB3779617.1 uracil-DNA glycosylase [Desulfurococcales archaeon]
MEDGSMQREYERLVEEIKSCTKCPLHKSRKNAVPGEGPVTARIMVIGEAPGRREDEMGRPFVGQAGKLLNRLLEKAGLKREEVYITNIVKCRPPGNRDPRQEEINSCIPYLIRQVELIHPEFIIIVGRIAGQTLYTLSGLKWKGIRMARRRQITIKIGGNNIKAVVTYHPAAALYNANLLEELEEDFSWIGELLNKQVKGGRKTLEDFL